MSKSVNECLIVGNVGQNPKISQVSGTEVAQFSVATSQGGYKKQDGTEIPERTQWHNIVAWRGLAKIAQFIHKGDKVIIKGMINYRDYEKEGIKHYVTDIIANDIILTAKAEGAGRPALTRNDIPPISEQSTSGFPPNVNSSGIPIDAEVPEKDDELPF